MAEDALPFVDLPEERANALLRQLFDISDDVRYWHPGDWVDERALLNGLYQQGQACERTRQADVQASTRQARDERLLEREG